MSPGVNNGPRSTGTLPKSNRRSDRNRERSAANQFVNRSSGYRTHPEQSNNLFPLNWKPVSERKPPKNSNTRRKPATNSNTRSVSSAPSTLYQDLSDSEPYSWDRQYNYSTEKFPHWQKMVPPTDSRTESPPRLQGSKPSNVDKMPDRSQIETRLNQIRDYIRVTSAMMDSLSQSSDPRAQAQNEKLGRMVEDLHDSERKLSKLLEQYPNHSGLLEENGENDGDGIGENGDGGREMQLRRKMEDSQRKLAQLQEHQANLVGMQLRVRERLNEVRQAQQALLQQENQNAAAVASPMPTNVEQLESETATLRGKLEQLQTKKKQMDHLVAELQRIEMSNKTSSSSDGSRNFTRDKAAELEAMKAQLVHLKALLESTTSACSNSASEPEPDEMNAMAMGPTTNDPEDDVEENEEKAEENLSFDRQSDDSDEASNGKIRNTAERPTVEEIQAVTRELREQSALLQSTRAELQRLKQPLSGMHSNSTSMYSTSTPPHSLASSTNSEKKQSNNVCPDNQPMQGKRRQAEDAMRKESSQSSSINRDAPAPAESNSHRSSNSQISHTSTPANVWAPPTVVGGSNEQSVDGISSSEHLLDVGPPTTAIENGFTGNWWAYPPPPLNQLQHGSAEYYRQLLLGSQTQQLQMMGTTIQQCCQLLWSQQRELQSLRSAISQLQLQLRQIHGPQRVNNNNNENNDEYSNLSRSVHHLGETLDGTLPPSSSLPNLVSLPNSSPALSHTAAVASTNSQQHQQQQLNNQVPPGNRANNYWDNFRSYSRQNLLSGSAKTMSDTASGGVANSVSSGNTMGSSVNSSLVKDNKRNREHGTDHLPLPSLSTSETQYSVNYQSQSNLQQHERENTARSNILTSEVVQQQMDNFLEEASSSFRLSSAINDTSLQSDQSLQNLSTEMREALNSLISANKTRHDYLVIVLREIKAISEDHRLRPQLLRSLRALQDTQSPNNPLNEATDQTGSESCQSSDEDSEVGGAFGVTLEHPSSVTDVITSQAGTSSSPTAQVSLIDHLELPGTFSIDYANSLPSTSLGKPGYNEDLAEADQSRPESSGNQQLSNNEQDDDQGQEEAGYLIPGHLPGEEDSNMENVSRAEDERTQDTTLDKLLMKLYHQ